MPMIYRFDVLGYCYRLTQPTTLLIPNQKLRALRVSATAPASLKEPTVGALPPASMQSFVVKSFNKPTAIF